MSKERCAASDFGGNLCSDAAFAQAEQGGFVVVLPADNELLIDIDNDQDFQLFNKNLPKIMDYVGVADYLIKPSKSGQPERKHIKVVLKQAVKPVERMLLQAVLGSDLRRELLSYCRYTLEDPHPTLFFEKGPAKLPPAPEHPALPAASEATA